MRRDYDDSVSKGEIAIIAACVGVCAGLGALLYADNWLGAAGGAFMGACIAGELTKRRA